MSEDSITRQLRQLKAEIPKPRKHLSENDKDELIQKVGGILTTENILKAQKDLPESRIPFLFSSLDTQAVVDILANDMGQAIARARRKRSEQGIFSKKSGS